MLASLAARGLACSLSFVAVAAMAGCGRPPADPLVIYPSTAPELASAAVDATGQWSSCPWTGVSWLRYPPRGQIQVEHALGRIPARVNVYLAFDAAGTAPALAAGDLARVVDVDESTVTIWNDTNGAYFARVVIE